MRAGSKGHVHSTLSGKVTSKGRGPRGDRVVLGTVAKPRTDSLLPFPLLLAYLPPYLPTSLFLSPQLRSPPSHRPFPRTQIYSLPRSISQKPVFSPCGILSPNALSYVLRHPFPERPILPPAASFPRASIPLLRIISHCSILFPSIFPPFIALFPFAAHFPSGREHL